MLTVLYKGSYFGTIEAVRDFEGYVDSVMSMNPEINRADFSMVLAEVKAYKENELRDRADEWYRNNIRAFEGAIVGLKTGRRNATPEETAVADKMLANYERVRTLVGQVRAITDPARWRDVLAVNWSDPVMVERG